MKTKLFFILLAGLFLCVYCKEDKVEPAHFEMEVQPMHFTEAASAATFSITSNIVWKAAVTSGSAWCSVTPAEARTNATVKVEALANPLYLQERTATITVTAGDYSKEITITQAPKPCPTFNAGTIAATGQTVTVGDTPTVIASTQNAAGADTVTYQWYKNGTEINGATNATYTPPLTDAATVSAHTYTRLAKDNICSTTFTPSTGSWVLTVICPVFDAGAIAATGQTVTIGSTPIVISSVQDATSAGTISYQWYKNGAAISGATNAMYTPPLTDAAAASAHTYTRHAKDNICNTTFTSSSGSWVLTVVCPVFDAGAIATTGQTVTIGSTPTVIASAQGATSTGTISYQWYKNGTAISGATNATYTPPLTDAAAASAHTYTRHAKDNICNTTFTSSSGSWVLTVVCPVFDAGAIATTGQTVTAGGIPTAISSVQDATSTGAIFYQWYKDGTAISGATNTTYTPTVADVATAGVHTYTRHAKDNICNTTFTSSTGSWVLTVTCPTFDAGAIVTTGQTVTVFGTPITIASLQNATSVGAVSYQWYKNGTVINGATNTTYIPPASDAATVGAYTYTRSAKDNMCNTTLTPSSGSWVLTVNACNFDAGAIATTGQTIVIGGTPVEIGNTQPASGGDGVITYQWYKNSSVISGATSAMYTPSASDAETVGVHTYTRRAKDNTCNKTLTLSTGSWVLTVNACNFNAGAISATGQTIVKGGTPATIGSTQPASGGDGVITYQWYKNSSVIGSATNVTYTPPLSDANVVGVYTYTRYAKDNTCNNTTLMPSSNSWVLTVNTNLPTLTTQAATNISTGSATANGTVLTTGTPAYTERGFCYSTLSNPTTADTKIPVAGSGTGNYTASLTGLVAGTIYYVRAYAMNTAGTNYGNEITFTAAVPVLAEVSTLSITNIDETVADVICAINNVGVPTYTERGVCYSTSPNPTTADTKVVAAGAGVTGNYTVTLTGLMPGTTYYVRAYAINAAVTAYGNQGGLTTLKICTPNTLLLGTVSFLPGEEVVLQGSGELSDIYQVWSQPVTATGCQKTTFNGGTAGNYIADCRKNVSTQRGDLFSGCAIRQNSQLICPAGWHMPTATDLEFLMAYTLGGRCRPGVECFPNLTFWSSAMWSETSVVGERGSINLYALSQTSNMLSVSSLGLSFYHEYYPPRYVYSCSFDGYVAALTSGCVARCIKN